VLRSLVSRLTYANVVATLALFLALGGVSYAATQLPKNSVGSKQIKSGAITKGKIDKATLKALAGKAGPRGASGAPGAAGAPGAKGDVGAAGAAGTNGQDLTAHTPLASGQTETGLLAVSGTGGLLFTTLQFSQPLPAPLDPDHVVVLNGIAGSPHCHGTGTADPGYLCVYVTSALHATFDHFFDPADISEGADPRGTAVEFTTTGTSSAYAYGSWAVTAP
jgi:hypothetical protein